MKAQLAPMPAGEQFVPVSPENGNRDMVVDFQHRANGGMDANQLAGKVKEGTAGISANQRTF